MVTRRGFVSDRQRRGFFATGNFKREPRGGVVSNNNVTAFSYKDGKRIKGKFKNLQDVLRKNPSERKAFNTVMRFRRRTGMQNINNLKQIKRIKMQRTMTRRWDR